MQAEYTTTVPKDQEAAAAGGYRETLHDVSPTGRVRPWRQHRLEAELLAEAYHRAGELMPDPSQAVAWIIRGDKVASCATAPTFEQHRAAAVDGGQLYLTLQRANFCRDRLCPMCQWRRSLKMGAQARAVVQECNRIKIAKDKAPYKWLMLTLTQRNVAGPDLAAEIDRIHAAFKQLTRSPAWKAAAQGWLRVTEVTHNIDRKSPWYDTYHPHMHILLCVNRRYFKSSAYLTQDDWAALWQHYIHQADRPSVEIHLVKARGEQPPEGTDLQAEGLGAAVAEVSKYASKPGSYLLPGDLELTTSTVATLATALHGRRLAAWGGVCKQAAQALKLDSIETGDLVHIDEESTATDPEADAISRYIEYNWALGIRNYVPGRTWEAPAGWAAAAAAIKERQDIRPKKRQAEIEDMRRAQAKIHRIQSAAGPKIANRAIRARDGYTIHLLEEIANAKAEK